MVPSLFLLSSILIIGETAKLYPCVPCRGDRCHLDPDSCSYGVKKVCHRLICASGPGERCGGHLNIRGRCADGLVCNSCNTCTGCVLIGDQEKCYDDDLVVCLRR